MVSDAPQESAGGRDDISKTPTLSAILLIVAIRCFGLQSLAAACDCLRSGTNPASNASEQTTQATHWRAHGAEDDNQ